MLMNKSMKKFGIFLVVSILVIVAIILILKKVRQDKDEDEPEPEAYDTQDLSSLSSMNSIDSTKVLRTYKSVLVSKPATITINKTLKNLIDKNTMAMRKNPKAVKAMYINGVSYLFDKNNKLLTSVEGYNYGQNRCIPMCIDQEECVVEKDEYGRDVYKCVKPTLSVWIIILVVILAIFGIGTEEDKNNLTAPQLQNSANGLTMLDKFSKGQVNNLVIESSGSGSGLGSRQNGKVGVIDLNLSDEQARNVLSVIDKLKYISSVANVLEQNPVLSKCSSFDCTDLTRKSNETEQQYVAKLACCLKVPGPRRDLSIDLPEPETPDQLPPPGGQQTENIMCTPICYNGFPGIRCMDQTTGEIVSETYENSQNIDRCCRNECINDTWHTVCVPHSGINSGISCDERPPKL